VSRGLHTEPLVGNTQLYKNREGEWATWEINREERGRICRDQVGRPDEQVAEGGGRPEQVEDHCWGRGGARATKQPLTQ
jgi:hypothetical protein